jgi:hypothetical protein
MSAICRQGRGPKAFADSVNPSSKVFGDELMRGAILRVDFERQASKRAAILRVGHENSFEVAGKNGEDAVDRLRSCGICGLDNHRMQCGQITFQNLAEQRLLAVEEEEVVKASRVYLRVGQQVGHQSARESSFPEQITRGLDKETGW